MVEKSFYSLKRGAHKIIKEVVDFLKANPSKVVYVNDVVLKFQEEFGFGLAMLKRMLEPFVQREEVIVKDGYIKSKPISESLCKDDKPNRTSST